VPDEGAAPLQGVQARTLGWLGLVRLLPRAGTGLVTLAAVVAVLAGLLPITFILATGNVLSAVYRTAGSEPAALRAAATALVVAVGAFALQQLLTPLQAATGAVVARRIDGECAAEFMTVAMTAPLAAVEEDSAVETASDATYGFMQGWQTPGLGAAAVFGLLSRYLQLAAAVVVVGVQLAWPVAALVGAAALAVRRNQRIALARYGSSWWILAAARRRFRYLWRLGLESESTKEVRSLGLSGWLEDRHGRESRDYLTDLWVLRRGIYFRPFLGYSVVALLAGVLAFASIARSPELRTDVLGLSVAIQALLMVLMFGTHFADCDVPTEFGLLAHRALHRYRRQVGVDQVAPGPAPDSVPAPGVAPTRPPAVAFAGVHFGYSGSGREVLRGLDLTLPAGRSTAIVGLNGAGKTTLVKLLCGLYQPDRGRISVDGVDLARMDPAGWRRRIAVILQSFIRFELSVRDNVALGGLGRGGGPADDEAILRCLTEANARGVLTGLPSGLDTLLSPHYREGVDLSGGQWQRLALARALYAVHCGASLLVLDEPTAQLDVRAEVAFFDRFFELTAGLTTVVVSHRFSTVRRADRIVVLADGHITESGTHADLLAANGSYATMFRLQASKFGPAPALAELAAEEPA
jgi:ATP-binding cassette, subfamily B, bacterial